MSHYRELIIIMSTPPTVKVCVDEEGGINPQAFLRVCDFVEVDLVPSCGFGWAVLPPFNWLDLPDALIFGDFLFIRINYLYVWIVCVTNKLPSLMVLWWTIDRLFQVIIVVDDTSVYCFHLRIPSYPPQLIAYPSLNIFLRLLNDPPFCGGGRGSETSTVGA